MTREKLVTLNQIRRLYKATTGKTLPKDYMSLETERQLFLVDEIFLHVDTLREETLRMLDK
jgi:hypothetical protein